MRSRIIAELALVPRARDWNELSKLAQSHRISRADPRTETRAVGEAVKAADIGRVADRRPRRVVRSSSLKLARSGRALRYSIGVDQGILRAGHDVVYEVRDVLQVSKVARELRSS